MIPSARHSYKDIVEIWRKDIGKYGISAIPHCMTGFFLNNFWLVIPMYSNIRIHYIWNAQALFWG